MLARLRQHRRSSIDYSPQSNRCLCCCSSATISAFATKLNMTMGQLLREDSIHSCARGLRRCRMDGKQISITCICSATQQHMDSSLSGITGGMHARARAASLALSGSQRYNALSFSWVVELELHPQRSLVFAKLAFRASYLHNKCTSVYSICTLVRHSAAGRS